MFEVEPNRIKLALKLASFSLEKKSFDPLSKSILFIGENNQLTIRTRNDLAETKILLSNVKIKEAFEFVIDGFLIETLVYSRGDVLKFSRKKNKVVVSSGRGKNSFPTIDTSEFPNELTIPNLEYYKITDKKKFLHLFKPLSIAISETNDQPMLKTYYINPHTKKIITADGDKIMRIESEDVGNLGNISNPRGSLLNPLLSIISGLSDEDELNVFFGAVNSFKIKSEDMESTIKIHSDLGEYNPKADEFLDLLRNTEPLVILQVGNSNLKEIINQAVTYCDAAYGEGKPHHTTLSISNTTIFIHMAIENFSEMKQELECKKIGGETEVQFYSKDMQQAINMMGENLELKFFKDGLIREGLKSPFLILDVDNPELTYLQVQMQLT